jgi:hypothetical protein
MSGLFFLTIGMLWAAAFVAGLGLLLVTSRLERKPARRVTPRLHTML